MLDSKNLVIIPARKDSKRIPQKNSRFIKNKPLIAYTIEKAKLIIDADLFLVTDDPKIREIGLHYGIKILDRPDNVSGDRATIDDVAFYALNFSEKHWQKSYSTVITLQPTSPLLKVDSLLQAIERFNSSAIDTLLSVKEVRHLLWGKNESGFSPLYQERVNSQQLKPFFQENGAFVICQADILRKTKTRIGPNTELFVLSEEESLDIDNVNDLILAESILTRRNIGFVFLATKEIGMGHLYRGLTLANSFVNHRVYFFSKGKTSLGLKKLKEWNREIIEYEDEKELLFLLKKYKIEILINDILNTTTDYVQKLKGLGLFVVNFEDLGNGSMFADLKINSLYEYSGAVKNNYYGYKYECLREDIALYPRKREFPANIKKILLVFGGTDPNNGTLKVLQALENMDRKDLKITVILGSGFAYQELLQEFLAEAKIKDQIKVLQDVSLMGKYIHEADLAIIGNGRMTFEVAAIGTPMLVFSQNERELKHLFSEICPGAKHLGLITSFDEKLFFEAFFQISNYSWEVKQKISLQMSELASDLRKGTKRVIDLIFENFGQKEV